MYECVSGVSVSVCPPHGAIRLSPGRWGSRRRCCICLCSLRGPSLRPAARTPHRPRPNAGSHCWRRSRNSDQHPERWRWLSPVTRRGHTHRQLEHGRNWTNTCKCHRHLTRWLRKQTLQNVLFFPFFFFSPHTFGPRLHCFCRWVMIGYEQPLNETHTRHDIAPARNPDNQMDGALTCDPRGGPRTQPLCLLLISCMGLGAKDQRWRSDWAVEISGGLTGDNRLPIGKLAQLRNSFAIRTSYWPVAYDAGPAQYAWYWVAMPEPDCFSFACLVRLDLLTKQQWIFTCLLTHLIGFTHCTHLNTYVWIE